MLDFPATGRALWALFDAGGPRPEYVLPVLYSESGFDPSTPNLQGYGYYGVGQTSAARLADAGVDPNDFLTWQASAQIERFVSPMMLGIVHTYGPIESGTRAYQANFLPATLATARSLDSVLARAGESNGWYSANAGLDWGRKGYLTVRDLAHSIEKSATSQAVQSAIAQTYALRSGESPRDPVLGDDFASTSRAGASTFGQALVGGLLGIVFGVGAWAGARAIQGRW
jgi:hypothetical protein